MKRIKIIGFTIFLIALTFLGCEKDPLALSQKKILGTWISINKTDTLDFVDKDSFYKSSFSLHYDHFSYRLDADSMKIGYSGILFILIVPTKHKYSLDGNTITIDFNNENCYGFSQREVT